MKECDYIQYLVYNHNISDIELNPLPEDKF